MARMRVHELAKELNVNNKDLIERIVKLGIQAKNHMSTLSESAVQKIRQHFLDSTAEEVEQKRIGRAVIRRRKRVSPEEPAPSEQVEEVESRPVVTPEVELPVGGELPPPVSVPGGEKPAIPPAAMEEVSAVPEETPPTAPQAREEPAAAPSGAEEAHPVEAKAPPAGGAAPEPAPSVPQPKPTVVAESIESATVKPVERKPAAQEEAPTVVEESVTEEAESPVSAVEVEKPPAAAAPAVPEAKLQPPAEVKTAKEAGVEASADALRPAPERPAQPVPPQQVRVRETLPEAEAGTEEAEEAEAQQKPRKTKKRRRKKAPKDEPARIIKLPEIIEEPEEEPEILTVVPQRLQAIVEETEAKDAARKRRTRTEEPEKEAPGRKWRGPGRKEVVEREDLYSKRELAAQAGRERVGRDRDRYAVVQEAPQPEPAKAGKRSKIKIDEAITIANLAKQMGVKAGEVIKKLLILGLPANINQAIDFDTAALVASEFDFEVEKVGFEEEEFLQAKEDRPEDLVHRPPVVTVMGHVDHGKTSLLDAIRQTNVIAGEAGGITQHIGAYYVKLDKGDVVFLDTPGHEAFTAMRARGATVTDIVILVVAADDGVMPQTVEAINHSKAAGVPIIVAINKIDKPNANLDRVRRELADHGLIPEQWGGNVTMVEVSAKKNIGIEELLEMVLLQAEIMELKGNPNKLARGRVIEAKLDRGRGPVATILIQEGTLKAGDAYVCGVQYGRVRNMFNDRGQRLDSAGPAMPVEVLGLSGVPNAGDDFTVVADEKQAKMVAEHRLIKQREKELSRTSKVTLERLYEQIQEGEIKELNVILKTDVQGSLEAISDSLQKLSTPSVKVNLIHNATGAITETDIMLASASNAIVIGFNVRADGKVQELAEQERVDVRYYDVIYQIISDIKDAMVGMLEPVYRENVIGHVEVRQTFHVPKVGTVAGCYVLDGRIERSSRVRVLRDQVVIYDGKILSLKRFKDDVKEVKAGFECGIGVENFNDIKVNDTLEVYELQEVKPTLDEPKGKRE